MPTNEAQPIAGVSAGTEAEVMTVYPSIAATWPGSLLGSLYESIPLGNGQIKLSHLLFPLPTSPFAALLYFYMKVFDNRYMLTNRAVKIWSSMGNRLVSQIDLTEIADIAVTQQPGQVFFKCSDLQMIGNDGKVLMRLSSVPRAEVFRETILKARDAVLQVKSSLATIEARQQPATAG